MIINHSGFQQSATCWWCKLFPSWKAFAENNFLDSEVIIQICAELFDHVATNKITETLTRQDLFENPKYIISKNGRKTDSSWAAVPENEVTDAIVAVEKLIAEKKWEAWFEKVMEEIEEIGQSNNLVLKKK